MKQILLTLIINLLLCSAVIGQTYVVRYTYDVSGNRIKRQIYEIILKNAKLATEDNKQPIEEAWGERKITIYPNPTQGKLKISITGGDNNVDYNYTLYNASGQKILLGQISHSGVHPIPMQRYRPGIYILVLRCEQDKKTYKIIKE